MFKLGKGITLYLPPLNMNEMKNYLILFIKSTEHL